MRAASGAVGTLLTQSGIYSSTFTVDLTPWNRPSRQKLRAIPLVKNCPVSYRTQLVYYRHWTLL
jgi:hypothetical protein